MKLPPSVHEWYSLAIGLPMLHVNGAWWPLSIEQFGAPYPLYLERSVQLLDYHLLVFIGEQQSGDWCVQLNDQDDPPIYWLGEEDDRDRLVPDLQLRQDAPAFSDFVYCFL